MAGMWHKIQNAVVTSPSATEVIFTLLHSLSVTLSQRMAALIWSSWKHRNVKVWVDIAETCVTVVDRARSMVEDLQLANAPCINTQSAVLTVVLTTAAAHTQPAAASAVLSTAAADHALPASAAAVPVRWKVPAQGRMKWNIDAAFSDFSNRTDIGICLLDEGVVCLFWPKQSALLVFTRLIFTKSSVSITPCNG
jgi:hypothetical protein